MQCLEVSGAVRPIYGSLGVKRLKEACVWYVIMQHHIKNTYHSTAKSILNTVARRPHGI